MKIALFAADEVGLRVAQVMRDRGHCPTALVVDPVDRSRLNDQIQVAAGTPADAIFVSDGDDQPQIAEVMRTLSPDLGISAWWPYIIRDPLLSIFDRGILNIHPSLLPHGRGKDPNFWALRDGTAFGVTIHWITDRVDNGPIAFQTTPIDPKWTDTGGSLYRKALDEATALFKHSFDEIVRGEIPSTDQGAPELPTHRRADLEPGSEIRLDETYTARELLNLLRARTFPPHPGAWFVDQGRRYEARIKIWESESGEES